MLDGVDADILSCYLRMVLETLVSPILNEEFDGDEHLKKLGIRLSNMQAVFNDADMKQRHDPLVRRWLADVNDLVFDAKYISDLYATYVGLRHQVCSSSHASSSSTSLNSMRRLDIEPWLKEIMEKSEKLAKQMGNLCLKTDVGGRPTTEIVRRGRETSALVDESRVYDRDFDKNKIIQMLQSDGTSGRDKVGVLPIVGMGGLGKTTLAQLVYNDERVMRHFDLQAWVCVSQETNVIRITKAILESITKKPYNLEYLDLVQEELAKRLKGKRFLIVLDDIWNENPNFWEELRKPFKFGKRGSKILITTRSVKVSEIMGTISAHSLGLLANDNCLSLFWQHAAVDEDYLNAHPNLKAIGMEIVKKCNGLPLAVKTLGSLCRSKHTEDEWKDMLTTDMWDIQEDGNHILEILRLSYKNLPSHLKLCFAYCSTFPKDYIFNKEELVLMWMAEGFVGSLGRKTMEDTARSYFDELLSRSFFQHFNVYDDDDTPRYVMHDLIHDLAQSISPRTNIALDANKLHSISEKACHVSLVYGTDQPVVFDAIYHAKSVSTFLLLFPFSVINDFNQNQKGPHDLFRAWRCLCLLWSLRHNIIELPDSIRTVQLLQYLDLELDGTYISTLSESVLKPFSQKSPHYPSLGWRGLRVLCLQHLNISQLPDSFGGLILLRYLDLDGTCISTLPSSVYTLINLQTLIIGYGITELPDLCKLINLRHIKIREIFGSMRLPCGIGTLTQLQTLSDFVVGKRDGTARLRELEALRQLRGRLCISGLENVVDVTDAKKADLKNKHISKLLLKWSNGEKDIDSGEEYRVKAEKILECLQPHNNLEELSIWYYSGMCFPSWIATLSYLVKLHLYFCGGFQVLPPLGQLPLLKLLKIRSMVHVKHVYGCEVVKGFPSLERLEFKDMPEWEDWSSIVEESQEEEEGEALFPRLAYLTITQCPKLTRLPFYRLPSLVELTIHGCEELTTLPRLRIPLNGVEGKEFPYLQKLKIYSCHKLRKLPHLIPLLGELEIEGCGQLGALPKLPRLHRLYLDGCDGRTLFTRVDPLPCLSSLFISRIRRPNCLTNFLQSLTALEELRISNCKDLKALGSEVVGLHHLTSLKQLEIVACGKLVLSFPKEENGLLTELHRLELGLLNKLESLPHLWNLTSLVELEINKVPRLASFPETGLPPNLQKLQIAECMILKSLPKGLHNLTCLKVLIIDQCPGLTSFAADEEEEGGLFPPSLESLHVIGCKKLKELSRREWIHHSLTSLGDSMIHGCRTITALKEIWIEKCKNLESLPTRMQNLTSLEMLSIVRCPRLVTLPEGGLPTNLKELKISERLYEWVGTDIINSLHKCTIN